jgi:hypothetical protein
MPQRRQLARNPRSDGEGRKGAKTNAKGNKEGGKNNGSFTSRLPFADFATFAVVSPVLRPTGTGRTFSQGAKK